MKNITRVMSLVVGLGLLGAVAVGCGQSSDTTGNTPGQNTTSQNTPPAVADTNAVPSVGMNTNSPATTSTNTP